MYPRDSLLGGIARTGKVDGVYDVEGERKSSSGVDAVGLWAVAEGVGISERVDEQADCTQIMMIWPFAVDGYCWYYIDRGFLVPVMIANEQTKLPVSVVV